MLILGVSAPKRDASAALLSERGIEAAIEESKVGRSRACAGVPVLALQTCLDQAHENWKQVPLVALASRPRHSHLKQAWLRIRSTPVDLIASVFSRSSAQGAEGSGLSARRVLRELTNGSHASIVCFEHQLCHAASAFYASPFDRALILTLDEQGDGVSGTVSLGEGNRIRTLQSMPLPHSVGRVYSQITSLIGFVPRLDEHKTQWLSLQGDADFKDVFLQMLRGSSNGSFRLDLSYFDRDPSRQSGFSDKFYRRLGFASSNAMDLREGLAPQIACSLQQACSAVLSDFLEKWRVRTRAKYLCLAGGVFLNVLLVSELESGQFDEVFVQPASGNAGGALGAAWLAWHQLLGNTRQKPLSHVYLGPSFSPAQTKEVLDNCKAPYRWFRTDSERNSETIRLLEAGKIVAWYQGATEFGPRALGNRSLLASPWAPFVRENLNDYIKHREHFRPFALSVAAEDSARYFDCSPQARFMTSIATAKPAARELIRDFLLPGNRVRLHAVHREVNPAFWQLLKEFGERSPAPLLVNASFNLFGEPLVNSPRDAVRSFYCSGVDVLVMGGFMVLKR